MKKTLIFLPGIFLLFFFFQSCRKNKSLDLNPNVNVANDVIISVSSYSAVFNLLIKSRLNTSLANNGYALIDSAYITYDSAKREYDFDFYSASSPDGIRRSGRIAVVVSGDILQKGSYANVHFQGYYEDYGKVDGTDSIANEGVNTSGQVVYSVYISHGSIEKVLGGGTINAVMNVRYKTPVSALVPGMDILFLVQGNISGGSSKGYAFSASIRDTILDQFSCPWFSGGIIDVHVQDAGEPDGYIDFVAGDGCSDVIWYYFNTSEFKVLKNQFYLKN